MSDGEVLYYNIRPYRELYQKGVYYSEIYKVFSTKEGMLFTGYSMEENSSWVVVSKARWCSKCEKTYTEVYGRECCRERSKKEFEDFQKDMEFEYDSLYEHLMYLEHEKDKIYNEWIEESSKR